MKKIIIMLVFASLAACASPVEMKNYRTGQVTTCKGSVGSAIFGGMLGHRKSRNDCYEKLRELGFTRRSRLLDEQEALKKKNQSIEIIAP